MDLQWSCTACNISFDTKQRKCTSCNEWTRWSCAGSGSTGLYKNLNRHKQSCTHCSPHLEQAIHEQKEAEKENHIRNVLQHDEGQQTTLHGSACSTLIWCSHTQDLCSSLLSLLITLCQARRCCHGVVGQSVLQH
jgi:hypothetical protein